MIIANLITGPFYGLYQLCQSFLQSTGKASYATFTAFLDKGLYYLPILFLMEHFFGPVRNRFHRRCDTHFLLADHGSSALPPLEQAIAITIDLFLYPSSPSPARSDTPP